MYQGIARGNVRMFRRHCVIVIVIVIVIVSDLERSHHVRRSVTVPVFVRIMLLLCRMSASVVITAV